jgi:hypothetical protein
MSAETAARDAGGAWRGAVRSLPALAGIGFTVSWILSFVVGAPMPSVAASGGQVVAAFAGQDGSSMANFVLSEGIPPVFLAVVVLLVAGAARRAGARRAGLAAAGFGLAAAVMSWPELVMGSWLVFGPVASRQAATAGSLWSALNRVDGSKMLVLAAMAVALAVLAASSAVLPRWLAPLGLLLAVSLVASGLGYLLLWQYLADAANVSGALLLIVVTATGVTLRRATRP